MIRPLNALIVPATALTLFAGTVALIKHVDRSRPTPPPVIKEITIPIKAEAPRITVAEFPHHFEGSFLWDGETAASTQHLAMDVAQLNQSNGTIVATGRGTYNTSYRDVDFTFRIEVNPRTGEFTMWESDPSVDTNFVTNGKHVAHLTNTVDTVQARWIGDDGDRGRLTLKAVPTSKRIPAATQTRELPTGTRIDYKYRSGSDKCLTGSFDRATVHYKGWNHAGVFDNSWERGRPATMSTHQVIPGFAEAMRGMCEGDFLRVWIPAAQAYGNAPGRPSGDLVFDIEMMDVIGR